MATCGYNLVVTATGIRELKNNLSRYIRRIEAGERIAITTHGRVVAELVPPGATAKGTPSRPSSKTSRTAPIRNSSLNCRRARLPAVRDPILDIVSTFLKGVHETGSSPGTDRRRTAGGV